MNSMAECTVQVLLAGAGAHAGKSSSLLHSCKSSSPFYTYWAGDPNPSKPRTVLSDFCQLWTQLLAHAQHALLRAHGTIGHTQQHVAQKGLRCMTDAYDSPAPTTAYLQVPGSDRSSQDRLCTCDVGPLARLDWQLRLSLQRRRGRRGGGSCSLSSMLCHVRSGGARRRRTAAAPHWNRRAIGELSIGHVPGGVAVAIKKLASTSAHGSGRSGTGGLLSAPALRLR